MAGSTSIFGGDAGKAARDGAAPKSGAADDTLDDAAGDQDEDDAASDDGERPAFSDLPAGMDLDFGNLLGSARGGVGYPGHAAM